MRLILILFMTGCTYSIHESIDNDAGAPVAQREAPIEPEYIPVVKDAGADVCVPQTFAADQIPYGFQYDINCPPNIYDPPRWIPPWDIGPIIKDNHLH